MCRGSFAFLISLALVAGQALAGPVQLKFINKTESSESIYITFNNTFAQPAFGVSYTDNSGSVKSLSRNSEGFSNSINLSNVKNATFDVTSLVSGGFYVSFNKGLSGAAPSPFDFSHRYFQVEYSIFSPGDAANNGDFTAVNLYSASIKAVNYNGSKSAGDVGFGGTSTAKIFKNLYTALKSSGELGSGNNKSVITKNGKFVRVLSPSNWGKSKPISGGGYGYSVGPYHSFNSYAKWLYLGTGNSNKPQVTNIKYIFQTGTNTFNGKSNPSYTGLRYECIFTATPTKKNGNYSFGFSGKIKVYSLPAVTLLGTVDGLTAQLPYDTSDSQELSYMVYAQPYPFTENTKFNKSNWTDGKIVAGDAALAQQFVLGDLEEGLLTGFVGSNVKLDSSNCNDPDYDGKKLKAVSSDIWWSTYTGELFDTLQSKSDPARYSNYSSVIFPAGNTYSAPYDDRFQSTHNPDIPVNTKWEITLNSTGDLTVPD